MYYVEIALFLAGLFLLIIGYRRTHRNMLLAAAIALFLSAGIGSLVNGFAEGYSEVRAGHSTGQ